MLIQNAIVSFVTPGMVELGRKENEYNKVPYEFLHYVDYICRGVYGINLIDN